MANDRQFKLRTAYVGTRGVQEYRASIQTWVEPDDRVLEIGCEWGTTTALLAERCSYVLGTDVSRKVIERARELHPGIAFDVLDAFDVKEALRFGSFTKIYIDMSGISGYRSTLDLLALLSTYATLFAPKAIVVKSGALKQLAQQCVAWSAG